MINYDEQKDLLREPQQYKDIKLYPILLFDYKYFELFNKIMCFPKDYISEKQIMKASYIKYLLFFIQNQFINQENGKKEVDFVSEIEDLMGYITKEKVMIKQVLDVYDENNIIFHYDIYIGKNKLSEYDFDIIREILLIQNGTSLEYIESFNPELEESLKFLHRSYKSPPPIKTRINMYSVISRTPISEMKNWTVVEFEEKEDILKVYEIWKIYKPLEVSGKVEFKSKNAISSPFEYSPKSKDRYSELLVDAETMMKNTGLNDISVNKNF